MIWAMHVPRIGDRRELHTGFWWGNIRQRDRFEDLNVNGRILLKLVLKKWDGIVCTGLP
jgi:hypothetical protein